FRNVDRQVADPFEVSVDLDRRHNRAEINGHRLMESEQRKAAVVDFNVELVDRAVAVKDARDRIRIAPDQAVDSRPHAVFGKTTHFKQACFQLLEIGLKMTRCRFRHMNCEYLPGSGMRDPGSVYLQVEFAPAPRLRRVPSFREKHREPANREPRTRTANKN